MQLINLTKFSKLLKYWLAYVLFAFLPLLIGTYIYLSLSKTTPLLLYINKYSLLQKIYDLIPKYFEYSIISILLKNYFIDYLWGFSFSFTLYPAISVLSRKPKHTVIFVVTLSGFIYEIMQYFSIFNGTGDIIDVLLYFLASITSVIVIGKWFEHDNHKMIFIEKS